MTLYWVIGGRYASTAFQALAPGAREVREGPFSTRAEAEKVWSALSWQSVDECNTRFAIIAAAPGEKPSLPRGADLDAPGLHEAC